MDQATAKEFYLQLERFSRLARFHTCKTEACSPWGEEAFKGVKPTGCIVHYTASTNFDSTVSWFVEAAHASKSSAHLVVGRQQEPWAANLAKGFPLVAALPCTVVQVRQPQSVAWHATWANHTCYGIELVNAGELRGEAGHWRWWPQNFTAPYPGTQAPLQLYGRNWEAWPAKQLETCAQLIAYANAYFGGSFLRHMVLGHEQVQGTQTHDCGHHDKRDPGPGFPLHEVRDAALANKPQMLPADLSANAVYARHAQIIRQGLACGNVADADVLQRARAVTAVDDRFAVSILGLLGYAHSFADTEAGRALNAASVEVFKTLVGLPRDKVLDAATRAALLARLHDRLFPTTPNAHVA